MFEYVLRLLNVITEKYGSNIKTINVENLNCKIEVGIVLLYITGKDKTEDFHIKMTFSRFIENGDYSLYMKDTNDDGHELLNNKDYTYIEGYLLMRLRKRLGV